MNANNVLQPVIFIAVLLAAAVPISGYLTRVMDGTSRVTRRSNCRSASRMI